MIRSNRKTTVALGAVALVGAIGIANASHSWGNYHWARTANPFTLNVGDNVSGAWDPYLDEAIADWNPSIVLDLMKIVGAARGNCRPTAGRIEVCNANYGSNGWLGIAQIWANGSHITQATAKMNDTYFNTATYNTPAWRRMVMCQEIAHDFGLNHQDETFSNTNLGSCMDYTSNPSGLPSMLSNEHPNFHDFEQLVTIYTHLDTTSTVSSALPSNAPQAMSQLDLDGPGQWGRLVRDSKDGSHSEYELDFGNGHKVLTHVIWASGERRGQGRQ